MAGRRLRTSAPGKAVLLGEYAVLFGAPAVVTAVNRRARATAGPAPAERWIVEAPGLIEGSAEFEIGSSPEVRWRRENQGARLPLVTHVIEQLVREGRYDIRDHGPLALEVDTTDFSMVSDVGRTKLGLGSSAAATVVLTAVLVAWARAGRAPEPDRSWLHELIALHRELQGGRGSGIDVAASLYGGAVEFRCRDGSGEPSVQPLELPEGLHFVMVWTGRAAGTTGFLERLEARRTAGRRAVDSAITALAAASDAGLAALRVSNVRAFLEAVDAFWSGLSDLGHAIEMPILSAEHLQLRELATECGVHYKPSGAGGGDLGVAFADTRGPLRELEDRAREFGFLVPDIAVDRLGLHVEGM